MSYIILMLKGFLKYRKRRKNLTIVLIGSFFLIFLFYNIFDTIYSNIEEYWGKMLCGSGSIVLKSYKHFRIFSSPDKKYYFNYNSIKKVIEDKKNINFSRRFRFSAMLETYNDNSDKYPVILIGIDPKTEPKITSNLKVKGRLPEEGKNEICLFSDFIYSLGSKIELGSKLIVYTQNTKGYINYEVVKIVGILEPVKVQYFFGSDFLGFVPLSFATSIKGVDKNTITEEVFSTSSLFRKLQLKFLLPDKYKTVNLYNSEDIPLTMKVFYNFILWVLMLMILGIVFSTIYHNVSLMIIERIRDIGVYLTFGASPGWVLLIFLGELTFYVIYCSILGGLFSTLLIYGINNLGIYASSLPMELFLNSDQFMIHIHVRYYFISFFILWIVIILATLRPILYGVNDKIVAELFR